MCVSIPLMLVCLTVCFSGCNRSVRVSVCVSVGELKGLQRACGLSGYRDREVNSRSIEGQISQH